jgi:DNA-binding transcriptional ArsR family regulator
VSREVDIAAVGALLADRGRASMLTELLGGQPLAAGELARRAGISPSGASNHLKQLLEGGLVTATASGRSRVYRLADAQVADALEALGRIAPARNVRGLKDAQRYKAIAEARTCYDHLAGRLGVQLTRSLVRRRILREADGSFTVSRRGELWFADELTIDVEPLRNARRAFALQCLDLTERQPHLAGALGAAVARAFLDRHHARRLPGTRALGLTPDGTAWLAAHGVKL